MRRLFVGICLLLSLVTLFGQVYAAEQPGKVTTISVYRGWGTDRELISAAIVEFEKAYPNIKVEIHDIADADYMTALMVQLASGVGPDIFMIQAPDAGKFIQSGAVLDLTSYFKRDIKLSDFLPAFASMTYKGHYYGVPLSGGGYRTDALYINRDIFNANGLPIPDPAIEKAISYQQFRDLAKKLYLDQQGDGKPERWGTYFGTDRWMNWLPSNGVSIFNEDYTDTLLDKPEAIEVLQFLQDMIIKDRTVDPKAYGFAPQRVAYEITWRDRVAANQKNTAITFDWSVAPQPAGRAGSVGITSMHPFSISATTKYPDAAWEFLKFVMSRPMQILRAKDGRAVMLRSVALSSEFVMSNKPPYNMIPFLGGDAVDAVRNATPPGVQTPDVIAKTLASLWKGEIPAETAARTMADAWRIALKNRK